LYENNFRCDWRLQKGDQLIVKSRRACSPGMPAEIFVAQVTQVRIDLEDGIGIANVSSKRISEE